VESAGTMSLAEWLLLLRNTSILREHQPFNTYQATLCFQWSKLHVTDELRRLDKLQEHKFEDFLEAFVRLTTFKALPSRQQLQLYQVESVSQLYQAIDAGENDAEVLFSFRKEWQEEEVRSDAEAVYEVLEMLIELLFDGVARTKDEKERPMKWNAAKGVFEEQEDQPSEEKAKSSLEAPPTLTQIKTDKKMKADRTHRLHQLGHTSHKLLMQDRQR